MFQQTIELYGGPGDGAEFLPVDSVPFVLSWPTVGREAFYALSRSGGVFRYIHLPGAIYEQEDRSATVRQAG